MRDESYRAGYRAGHLQGWRDAVASRAGSAQPDVAEAGGPRYVQSTPASRLEASTPSLQLRTDSIARRPALAGSAPPLTSGTPRTSAAPQVLRPQQPLLSPAAAKAGEQERREKRDRQNINITLYIASLLLVAAGALFIGANLPETLRFAGVCAITALFYGAGFVLHARAPRLAPAAVAFAGTGLALIPVTGLAMYNFALHNGPVAWLVTSLIGVVAYVVAAVRLESRVLVYLSLTFVVSTAWSGVSVLGGALVWYFTAMIAVAAVLTILALMRPRWLPPVYIRPLMDLHPFVVPAVAVAVTFVPLLLEKGEYALVMAMCGGYFALMAGVPTGRFSLLNFHAARVTLTVAAAVGVWHLTDRGADAFLTAAVLLAVQAMGIALVRRTLAAWFPVSGTVPGTGTGSGARSGDAGRWKADALVTFGVQLLFTLGFAVAVALSEAFGSGAVDLPANVPVWIPVLLAIATSMVLAFRLGGAAEWAPAAGLMLAGILGERLGYWPLAAMLVLGTAFWAIRSVPSEAVFRQHFVLAARTTVTLAVPVAVAAAGSDGGAQQAPVLLSLALALVGQQLVSAGLLLAGIRSIGPSITLAVFAGAGVLTMSVVRFSDAAEGGGFTAMAVLVQLVAALGIGWLLFPRSAASAPWRPTVPEALPLGVSLVAVPLAFAGVSQLMGNVALLLVVAYLVAAAVRLPGLQHRWAYWWVARFAGTTLILTAFHQLQDTSGPLAVGDERVLPAMVLVAALGLQLMFPFAAVLRSRAPRFVMADAAAVLGVQLAATAAIALSADSERQATVSTAVVALCAAAAGYVLREKAGSFVFAPAALLLLLVSSGGDMLDVELLLGTFAAFSAVMVVAVKDRVAKGAYFIAARVLTAGLVLVLSYDIAASVTAVSVTFALVLAAQHVIRWLMRSRLQQIPFQQAAVWITLAGQVLLPLGYFWQSRFPQELQSDDGGRWVVLLELVLLLVSAVVARRFFAARGAGYLTVYGALFGVVALGPQHRFGPAESGSVFLAAPVLSDNGVALVLLGMSLAATASRVLRPASSWPSSGLQASAGQAHTPSETIERWLWLAAAGVFAVSGIVLSSLASDWISGVAVLILAAVCFTASHVEKLPAFHPPAAAAVLTGATLSAAVAFRDVPGAWGDYPPWLLGSGCAGAGLYAVRLVRRQQMLGDPVRRWSLAGGGALGLAIAAAAGLWHYATSWTGVVFVALTAAVCYLEAPPKGRRVAAEVGALATTAALQRAVLFVDGGQDYNSLLYSAGPDPFWSTQWYVSLAGVLALLRYKSGHSAAGRLLLAAGAVLLSLSGLGIIFGGNGGQQLWVLALLAALLVTGLGLGERLFVWWGAAGVAVCIMWAMRQYTFAVLALIAVGLIAFAVWRLNRSKSEHAPAADPQVPEPTGPYVPGPAHQYAPAADAKPGEPIHRP